MKFLYLYPFICCMLVLVHHVDAQTLLRGKVYDAVTREAVAHAAVQVKGAVAGTFTDIGGRFILSAGSGAVLLVTATNYEVKHLTADTVPLLVALQPSGNRLQEVVVSGSRTQQQRSEVPVAISTINAQTISDAKANRLDQLLNKATGVFMVNLGNEQHEMSIRQPLTTKSLFLYLEDGIPIRTTGLYNHNALLEMNMAALRQVEVIRGPASSLYGAEAVGGAVNLLTVAPPALPGGMVSLQVNNTGYRRADVQTGTTLGKWGMVLSGYYANRKNGPIDYSDFHKTALTLRAEYKVGEHTTWSNSITYVDYYSDMTGALDSTHFARKDYATPYSFTYRKTTALRIKTQLTQQWNSNGQTQLTAMFRDNSVRQNPSYYIANSRTNPLLANGQINNSSFNSYLFLAQHRQKFDWLNSRLVAGISADLSPSTYLARYIQVHRDSKGNYTGYTASDSTLSNYATGINNLATYLDYTVSPVNNLKLVAALRYDFYHYHFRNYLPPGASTGAPSTRSDFNRVTPKLGFTYNRNGVGFYGNYSQGYVPPQVAELFNSVTVPYLKPQTFFNYEVGGWLSLIGNTLYADWSLYLLNGTNEIISVQLDDGTRQNQNAGGTRHRGVEYGLHYKPDAQWQFRLSATNARHSFVTYRENGIDYSGNTMSAAPAFIANAEVTYHPAFVQGLRVGMEWQHLASYWMDNANTQRYKGFNVFNLRAGYAVHAFELWLNALNVLNRYYSVFASKTNYGYSYNLGDPREFNVGVAYRFGR